jgi:site-specific DNA-methyltransferase (adenine-specific)
MSDRPTLLLPPVAGGAPTLDVIHHCSALELLQALPDGCVDLVVTDPPYGFEKTKTSWDSNKLAFDIIAFISESIRVLTPRGALCMFATPPFGAHAIIAGQCYFRYKWYGRKARGSNFGNSGHQPLRVIEEILVYSRAIASPNQFTKQSDVMIYHPQGERLDIPFSRIDRKYHHKVVTPSKSSHVHGARPMIHRYTERTPINLIPMKINEVDERGLHPTQKPTTTCRYLIRTYSDPGALILDPFMGSGTTAVAARSEGRHYIGCDLSAEYVALARERLAMPYTLPMFAG